MKVEEAPILRDELGRTVTPLRCIFWGGLLCILDFSFSSAVVHLFVSTSRMARAAAGGDRTGAGV